MKPSQTYNSEGSDYLDDVAKALYEIDLRPDLDDYQGNEVTNNVITHPIGFADDQVLNDPLMQDTAANGGGIFLTAQNAPQLVTALQQSLLNIQGTTSSLASVSLNGTSLNTDSKLYQVKLDTGNWSGDVLAYPLDPTDGTLQGLAWQAQVQLNTHHIDFTQSTDTRVVIAYDDSANDATSVGKPFQWNDLSQPMKDLLHLNAASVADGEGQARLSYLWGDTSNEGTGNNYRQRDHLLGDIVHSAPYYVGAPPFLDSLGPGYDTFYGNYSTRTKMIYVGSNSGILHGFNADNGNEALAFIPYAVFKNLSRLTTPAYLHHYYVDGSPTVGDAHAAFGAPRCGALPACWRSILVSGLRRGGQGFFALDVTDPASFNEANADKLVLWEFTDLDDVEADLG